MEKYTGIQCFFNQTVYLVPSDKTKDSISKCNFVVIKSSEFEEEIGKVLFLDQEAPEDLKWQEAEIIRKATPNDLSKFRESRRRSYDAIEKCKEAINKRKLDMRLVDAFFSFDNKRLSFFFTSDGRVDFRDFVKELAGVFQKRILLLQIGPRDKAKYVGGFGVCGRECCCKRFLKSMKSISMDMARTQGISSWGSQKLGGLCEKLMCCLAFELGTYESLRKDIPVEGDIVTFEKREAKVISVDAINKKMKIEILDTKDSFIVNTDEIKPKKLKEIKNELN